MTAPTRAADPAPSNSVPASDVPAFDRIDVSTKLFIWLASIFVLCLVLGDVIGGKLLRTPLGEISVGILPFPVTFLLTDVVNDFYGKRGARFLTLLGFAMAVLAWVILQASTALPISSRSYFTQAEFAKIFGGSAQLFVASMIAFLVGQFLDIQVFQFWKALTNSKHLWLRATGSTLLSQIVDTVAINVIFWTWAAASDPGSELGQMSSSQRWGWIFAKIGREYGIKLVVAVALTPAVYAIHTVVVKRLGIAPEPVVATGRA